MVQTGKWIRRAIVMVIWLLYLLRLMRRRMVTAMAMAMVKRNLKPWRLLIQHLHSRTQMQMQRRRQKERRRGHSLLLR